MKLVKIGCIISIFSLFSCNNASTSADKEVIAEVKGKYLYMSDLQRAIPQGLNPKDSLAFASHFIQNWATDELMFDLAQRNVPDEERINKMVEEYRRQLISSDFQRYLIEEKLGEEIQEEEIAAYFAAHKSEMIQKKDQIKGLFLKVPIKTPGINQLRNWMKAKKDDNIAKIEKFAIQHAAAYEYFENSWTDFDAVMANIPYRISNPVAFLRQNKDLEVNDSTYCYLLSIKNYALAGTPYTLESATDEIKKQLISKRKVDYLKRFRNDLLKKGMNEKEVIIHPNR